MNLRFCIFIIAYQINIVPAYLNEEVQEIIDGNKNQNLSCPNNKVLLQTLNILKENLVQNENQPINPDKFKHILDTTIEYLNTTQVTDEEYAVNHAQILNNIVENLNHRTKKDVLRNSPQIVSIPEQLSGKITLQYEFPTTSHPDCQTLFKAIVNAINVAHFQMNKFCEDSGKCKIQGENISTTQNSPVPLPSYLLSNQSNIVNFLGSYPKNGDVMNLLQNYRPNVVTKGNNMLNSEKVILNDGFPQNGDDVLQNNLQNTANPIQDINSGKDIQVNNVDMNSIPQNPDLLAIFQGLRPNYNNLIKGPIQRITQQRLNNFNNFPKNSDIMTLLQKYKLIAPNTIKNTNSLNIVNNEGSNGLWNDLTKNQGSLMEFLTVLNRPTGYMSVKHDSQAPGHANNDNLYFGTNTYPDITYTGPNIDKLFTYPVLGSYPQSDFGNKFNRNLTDFIANIPEDIRNFRLNGYVQNFPNNINDVSRINTPTLQSGEKVPKLIKTDLSYSSMPNYQRVNYMQPPQINFQNGKFFPNTVAKNLQESENIQKLLTNSEQQPLANIFQRNQNAPYQQYFNWYQNQKINPQQPFQRPEMTNILPNYNMFGVSQLPLNQANVLLNPDQQALKAIPISDHKFTNHNIANNSNGLSDFYRLTSMTNGPQLNMAPNKNGVVELTFTLQRPQSFVYKPLYYVKYRLPYKTYMYNVQNLIQRSPYLRNNPVQLYQELLAVANISDYSQDLKYLAKEDISKLIATNGALVKAKVLDETGETKAIEDDVKSILRFTSKLSSEEMLNATKTAINNVEEVIGNTTGPIATIDNVAVDDISSYLPVKAVNTRSVRYSPYPHFQNNLPIRLNNGNGYNIGLTPFYLNTNIMAPSRLTGYG